MSETLVIYHANCYDGYCCAWILHHLYPNATFFPATHNKPEYPDVKNKNVIIADFSYDSETTKQIASEAKSLIIFDHHITAKEKLEQLPSNIDVIFDITKAGCRLVWEYYSKNNEILHKCISTPNHSIPQIVKYIEDRDLWIKKLHCHEQIIALIKSYPFDFKQWDILFEVLEYDNSSIEYTGERILQYKKKLIDNYIKHPVLITLDYFINTDHIKHTVVGCNVTCADIISDVCDELLTKYPNSPFVIAWLDTTDNKRIFSFRSKNETAGALAVSLGGGGHKNAAGATFNIYKSKIMLDGISMYTELISSNKYSVCMTTQALGQSYQLSQHA